MAKSMDTYAEKLKDPRWQKKRLEIMQRDNWECKLCGDTKDTLAVHHISYINGNDPWDYDNEYLVTLCNTCHITIESSKPHINDFDINKVRAHCVMDDNEDAVTIYRYGTGTPIIVMKRGKGVLISKGSALKLMKILKPKRDGKG